MTLTVEPIQPALGQRRLGASKPRHGERVIAGVLGLCALVSVATTVGIVVALVAALAIGFINGYLVVKTGIPSFLVTLGTFFMLRGLNLAVTKIVTGNVATNDVSDIAGFELGRKVFASTFTVFANPLFSCFS